MMSAATTMPPAMKPAFAPSERTGFGVGASGDITGVLGPRTKTTRLSIAGEVTWT